LVFSLRLSLLAAAVLALGFSPAAGSRTGAADGVQPAAQTRTVTSSADSGPGTLRQALLDAASGDTITFAPASFPPAIPATITLAGPLPEITQGELILDASNAGVILDGSSIGATPEALLLDDFSLTLDGGPNLIANGAFSADLGHWRPWPWDESPGMTRGLSAGDYHSAPAGFEWSSTAHAGDGRTVYDTTNSSAPFDSDPFSPGSTAWIPVNSPRASDLTGRVAELRFWYRYGPVRVLLVALHPDGQVEGIADQWFERGDGWREAVVSLSLPVDASAVSLELDFGHSERYTNGLSLSSSGNTVWGLQVTGFPNAGIALHGGARNNVVGGSRGIGAGPLGRANLISGNRGQGVGIWGEGASLNIVRGNIIGADLSGTTPWGGHRDGVHINGADHNLVEDNLIAGYGTGVYVCCVAAGHNTVRGNTIGTNTGGVTGLGNSWAGVAIDRSSDNRVEDNVIARNGGPGVAVYGAGAQRNTLARNSIHHNGGPGIDLWDGGNGEPAAPLIFRFDLAAGAVSGSACPGCTVEVFSDGEDEGAVYEGQATAGAAGDFALHGGAPFTGPRLAATATDANGNTSEFSLHTSGSGRELTIQAGNDQPASPLQARCQSELADNRLGTLRGGVWTLEGWGDFSCDPQGIRGLKLVKLSFNEVEDWPSINWSRPELEISPEQDAFVTSLAENGIQLTYILNFWDKANHPDGWPPIPSRFTTEEEIQRYLDYVRFIVGHFKDRVGAFELWNEPDNSGSAIQHITPEDYVELVRRTVPVIREEFPEAVIVAGSVSYLMNPYAHQHLQHLIQSDVMPLVDVVAWHPMYGTSPDFEDERDYYYAYPGILQDLMATARAHGFDGEFRGDELSWCSPDLGDCGAARHMHTNITAAKYTSRGILIHRGAGLTVHLGAVSTLRRESSTVMANLATILAGAKPAPLPVQVQTAAPDVVTHTFALADGGRLLAIWRDGSAVEDDAGVPATLVVPGFAGRPAAGIDPLHSLVQPLVTRSEDGALVIEDLRVKDYVLFVRLGPGSRVYLPVVIR
jgi:hypothetical protein